MKKKLLSLLLALCLVMALVPMTAFAEENEQSNKTSITTVDELLQFAKAVDNGEYDDKTDAVVSLDADLDLTGVAWKPIGSVFDGEGNLLHYFSGKFYGNGHTISNLDFSENYGKTEYPSFGFFSEVYGAEISGLTVQGKLDVSNSGAVYFGTVAGVAADSKISDCVSDVSFTDTDKYINGTVALCGYAINSTIEYCQNKQKQEDLGLHCEVTIDGYTDFIFINRFGQAQHQATLNKAIRRIIRDCNDEQFLHSDEPDVLLPHFSCHSLRHTFTTRMCEAGVNIKVIQDALGHSDISTTLNIYADVTKEMKAAEFKGLDSYFKV